MFSKRFFLSLLTIGLMAAPMIACSDDNDDECNVKGYVCGTNKNCDAQLKCWAPCDGKAVGDVCDGGKVCDANKSCVAALSGGDAACNGKYVGYACDANGGKCDAKAKCVGGSVADSCASKNVGDSCGDNKVCDAGKSCVAALSGGDAACNGKYVGYACDASDTSKKCDDKAKCLAVAAFSPKMVRSIHVSHEASDISSGNLDTFVKGQYDLTFDLMKNLDNKIGNKNAMISAFSIQTALGMVYGGAAGDTKTQMADALHFDDNVHDALNKLNTDILAKNRDAYVDGQDTNIPAQVVKTSNNLYHAIDNVYTYNDAWLDLLSKSYDAGITEMDFFHYYEEARNYINKVVSDDTNERITELLPRGSVDSDTEFVLTNAVYFKSPWRENLVHQLAAPDDKFTFHASSGDVSVDALVVESNIGYVKGSNYAAVSIPLRNADYTVTGHNNDFAVLLILPDVGTSFDAVRDSLSGAVIVDDIIGGLSETKLVNLTFPSIEYSTSVELKAPLKALGMVDAFDMKANFSGIKSKLLTISEIYHQSYVAMDQNGVEAAAATALVMAGYGDADKVTMTVDRPYLFVIYDVSSKAPLFLGQVHNPLEKGGNS